MRISVFSAFVAVVVILILLLIVIVIPTPQRITPPGKPQPFMIKEPAHAITSRITITRREKEKSETRTAHDLKPLVNGENGRLARWKFRPFPDLSF